MRTTIPRPEELKACHEEITLRSEFFARQKAALLSKGMPYIGINESGEPVLREDVKKLLTTIEGAQSLMIESVIERYGLTPSDLGFTAQPSQSEPPAHP